jgi:hypothetical protein
LIPFYFRSGIPGNFTMKSPFIKNLEKGDQIKKDRRQDSMSPKKRKKSKFKKKKKKKEENFDDVIEKQSLQIVANYLQEMGLSELKGNCLLLVSL